MSALTRQRRRRRSLRRAQLWAAITGPARNVMWQYVRLTATDPSDVHVGSEKMQRYWAELNAFIDDAYQSSPPVTL